MSATESLSRCERLLVLTVSSAVLVTKFIVAHKSSGHKSFNLLITYACCDTVTIKLALWAYKLLRSERLADQNYEWTETVIEGNSNIPLRISTMTGRSI